MPEPYRTIAVEEQEEAEWLTLNRPKSLNAINEAMLEELLLYFSRLPQRRDIRLVVLAGAGRAFCSGLDLADIEGATDLTCTKSTLVLQRRLSSLILAMRRCPQVILCLLHGAASGGGFALALASDIRIAASDTRMNAAFIKVGLTGCDVGVSYHLPRIAGCGIAAELLLTGCFIDAERALSHGIVSEIADADSLATTGEAWATELLRAAPLALELTKEALNANASLSSLEAALALEDRQQVLLATEGEFARRTAAFRERRDS